ncbi:MAG: hypothetical protein RIQ33_901 [Bacteroidota bacterium]|jgi:hypothetical protein
MIEPSPIQQFSISSFPTTTRVWIYQADRNLMPHEIQQCEQLLQSFSKQWTAHQMPLKATTEIRFKRFIIFYVDESTTEISGCGIDKSVNLMKQIQEQLGIDFFNRIQIAYKINDEIKTFLLSDAKKLFAEKLITADTIIFNNLVNTKHQLETNWQQPLADSWLWKRVSA